MWIHGLWSFFTEVVPLTLLALQSVWALTEPLVGSGENTSCSRGGLLSTHGRRTAISDLVGRWVIQERHNMDEFLRGLGFGSIQRALIAKSGQETEIIENDDAVTIVTKDLRGSSALELPLDGEGVVANDGDDGATVCRSATVRRGAMVVTETLKGSRKLLSVCERKLSPDGRMVIDVRKRTPAGGTVAMKVIAARKMGP